jgi:hypothetical protein
MALLSAFAPLALAQNIAIGNATVIEGDTGTQTISFPVTITPSPGSPITLTVNTANGSATAGNDYVGITGGSVTIPAGAGSFGIEVTILNDLIVEPSETFTVAIGNPSAGSVVTAQALGTITDNDSAVLNLAPASQPEGNAGNSAMNFTATLSRPVEGAVTASFATTDVTAQVSDADYLAANGTLSFASGVTSQSITVQVVGDSKVELDERFALALSNLSRPPGITAVTLGPNASVEGTISNDDTATLTLTNATVTEGNTGTTPLSFILTASAASAIPLGATATTTNGSAVAPADYTALAGVAVVVPPGAAGRTVTIPVSINGDLVLEADETLTVALSAPTPGAAIGGGPATGTITNDDVTAISIGDVSQLEGTSPGPPPGTTAFRFPVTMTNPSELPVTVQFATADQTALVPVDYVATSGSVTFAPGSQTTEVVVQVVADGLAEADETFRVQLTSPAPAQASLARAAATGTIRNDDFLAVPVDDPRALLLLALLALATGIVVLRRSH